MEKTLPHGNRCQKDGGGVMAFSVFLLFMIVVTVGLLLQAEYSAWLSASREYSDFKTAQEEVFSEVNPEE